MRFIDFWVGIPLCFFLTVFNKLTGLFRSKKDTAPNPRKILFLKPSEMGGIVLSYPLIRRMQAAYPQAQFFFVTFECNRQIFDVLDIIPLKKIYTIRDTTFSQFVHDVFAVIAGMRKEKVDVVLDLEFFSRFTAILSYLSSAPKRIGFDRFSFEGLYRGDLVTHKVIYNPQKHISEMFLAFSQVVASVAKVTPDLIERQCMDDQDRPQYQVQQPAIDAMREKLIRMGVPAASRMMLMNLGDGVLALREWPFESFVTLGKKIVAQKDCFVLLIGTENCKTKARQFCQALGKDVCLDLTGQTQIFELFALFDIADALIANDCGLAHLASMTSIKQYVLFGPESPGIFAPLGEHIHIFYSQWPCSPCLSVFNHRVSTCKNNICIQQIRPDDVFQAIQSR